MTIERPEPLDDIEWNDIAEATWFCGIYRYRFDFEAIIKASDSGRFDWSIRLITDASGEPESEMSGDSASLLRASNKVRTIFAQLMTLPSVQGEEPC